MSTWDNNQVQFARLLAEIVATQDKLDIKALCESMDLEPEQINELFDRADTAWEAAKKAVDDKRVVMDFIKTLDADKLSEMALDEAVHDTASSQGSDANNGGFESQVEYLLNNGWSADAVIGYIKAEY
jgi:hypothetical protein